jgi:hypothetical protein
MSLLLVLLIARVLFWGKNGIFIICGSRWPHAVLYSVVYAFTRSVVLCLLFCIGMLLRIGALFTIMIRFILGLGKLPNHISEYS